MAKVVVTELLANALNELGGLVYIIVSDQPTEEPVDIDAYKPKSRIKFEFRLPEDPKLQQEFIRKLLLIVFYLVDQISVLQMSAEAQLKAQKQRKIAQELIQKKMTKKSSEEMEKRKAELEKKKKIEREEMEKNLSRDQKKKLEEKEHKKMLKQRVKVVKG